MVLRTTVVGIPLVVALAAACAPGSPGPAARAVRRGDADSVAFERRRLQGRGRFLTGADIARRSPRRLSDLFIGVHGVNVLPLGAGGAALTGIRSAWSVPLAGVATGACLADVYFDGMRVTQPTQTAPFDVNGLPLHLIRGVEVYRASEAPAQFSSITGCPVVLLWRLGS
jgi:hypothetical protein